MAISSVQATTDDGSVTLASVIAGILHTHEGTISSVAYDPQRCCTCEDADAIAAAIQDRFPNLVLGDEA